MLLLIAAIMIVLLRRLLKADEPFQGYEWLAIATLAIYLLCYFYLPPFAPASNQRMGLLYEMIPSFSLGAILFPELGSRYPEKVVCVLGSLGLLTSAVILAIFKLSVW
ncbi:hypothetical protein [Shewanella sp.]|uniref:hypothetical protein n=1 Tax=Shewanella sp. TaxID=50422 RepID=UPI000EC27BA2|nr:hypothetical protein [Shewanella sp.]MBZ4678745.1 hypothetical protein [Shewanella sp.]HCD12923.1 hypothetical protein [Shewanella sp.]